jgi:hypothetical protein
MKSEPAAWVGKPYLGFMMNAEFSDSNKQAIDNLARDIAAVAKDAAFYMPPNALHITLLDWVAPLLDYGGQDKQQLFAKIRSEHDKVISEILASVGPISVRFTELRLSPTTIFLVGQDNGEFQLIRKQFVKKAHLLPSTKQPPRIIHSSLVRFTRAIGLKPLEQFIVTKHIDIRQNITEFRLVKTLREPMLEFEVLKRYSLGTSPKNSALPEN